MPSISRALKNQRHTGERKDKSDAGGYEKRIYTTDEPEIMELARSKESSELDVLVLGCPWILTLRQAHKVIT